LHNFLILKVKQLKQIWLIKQTVLYKNYLSNFFYEWQQKIKSKKLKGH
mgnify:CR=1